MLNTIDKALAVEIEKFTYKQLNVLTSFVDHEGFVGSSKLKVALRRRLTHQFIAAMLSCNFSKTTPIIQRAYRWLMDSKAQGEEKNSDEWYLVLDKVEAGIQMGEGNESFCKKAVDLIYKRRISALLYQLPSASTDANTFNALWCTKILLNYVCKPEINEAVTETIDAFVNNFAALCPRARELSFLMNLYYKLHRDNFGVDENYQNMLRQLRTLLRDGLFDMPKDYKQISKLKKSGLQAALIAGKESQLHWSLISTCYVIENLADVYQSFPNELSDLVIPAIKAILGILKNQENIESVFSDQYKRFMITARCVSALTKYFSKDGNSFLLSEFMEENLELRWDKRQRDQNYNDELIFTKVIKNWLSISIKDPEYIRGGLSGSKIARIKPIIRIPAENEQGYWDTIIPHQPSLIIKFGKPEDLELERINYNSIPSDYRNLFAFIPKICHYEPIAGKVVEYLVIEDLSGYSTIEEFIPSVDKKKYADFVKKFYEFLSSFYKIPVGPKDTKGLIRRLYTAQFHKSIEPIHEIKMKIVELDDNDFQFMENIITINKKITSLEGFPLSPMHGDLNSRNIMVFGEPSDINNLRFRLIDLTKFSRSGDIAYDLGELLTDIKYSVNNSDNSRLPGLFEKSCCSLINKLDTNFLARLNMGKARSLLKILELRAIQALQLLGTNPVSDCTAKRIFRDEIARQLSEAYGYITDAVSMLPMEDKAQI